MLTQVSLKEIRDFLSGQNCGFQTVGDGNAAVGGFCSLNIPKDNCITWLKKPVEGCLSGFSGHKCNIIVSEKPVECLIEQPVFILTGEPKKVFFSILQKFWGESGESSIARSAVIKGKLGRNVSVGEHTFIGEDVEIGDNSIIGHNVSVFHQVKIGRNCIIHSGAVIGADGFGYYFSENGIVRVEHFGGVEIGSDVEIGANTCIDRGTIDNTVIGDNTKIDNLVHIAHNVQLGRSVCVVAGAVVCGSAKLKDGAYVAPGGIVKNQLSVGTNGFVGLGAVVTKSVEDKMIVAGVPAKPIRIVQEGGKFI